MDMKKTYRLTTLLIVTICCILVSNHAQADNNRPVTLKQMPSPAQQFIAKHFLSAEIMLSTVEGYMFDKNYDVVFKNGDKIEFNRTGEWTSVNCKGGIPAGIVPEQIASHVQAQYPGVKIIEIEKDDRHYDVKLSNRIELTFNSSFKLVEADFD
jgi:hypothetical protein